MAVKTRPERLQELLEVMKATFCVMKPSVHPLSGGFDLTSTEMRILFHIVHVDAGLSIKDLAAAINVSSSAATQFIDKLVEKKLVDREDDKADRRGVRIFLSKKVSQSFKQMKKQYLEQLQPLFIDLSNQELEQLTNLLAKIKPKNNIKI